MPFKDYNKKLAYARSLYKKYRTIRIRRVQQNKKRIKKWFEDYKKSLKCTRCGENHPATLDFHHRNSKTKEMGMAYLVAYGYSKKRIRGEIAKCDVLCANCHRKLHYKTAIFKRD